MKLPTLTFFQCSDPAEFVIATYRRPPETVDEDNPFEVQLVVYRISNGQFMYCDRSHQTSEDPYKDSGSYVTLVLGSERTPQQALDRITRFAEVDGLSLTRRGYELIKA